MAHRTVIIWNLSSPISWKEKKRKTENDIIETKRVSEISTPAGPPFVHALEKRLRRKSGTERRGEIRHRVSNGRERKGQVLCRQNA